MSSFPRERRRALRLSAVVLSLASAAAVPGSGDAGRSWLPEGYRVRATHRVAPGVTHFTIVSAGQRLNVARVEPGARARAVVVGARAGVARGRQATSAMCRRRDCLVGVNGDFFYREGRTAGAVVVNGEPWITRRYDRPHLVIGADGSYRTARIDIPVRLKVRYPHQLEPVDELLGTDGFEDGRARFRVHGINAERQKDRLIVYTPRRGERTSTSRKGLDVVARIVSDPHRLGLGRAATLQLTKVRERGNARIPRDGLVLSGRGRGADVLRALWQDVRSGRAREGIRLKVEGPHGARQVIGGRPVLLRDGEVVAPDHDWFSYAPHARTVAGWAADGTFYLVTIDIGWGARGMSLEAAARFMRALGCVGAINLDGGGSTTFVRRGVVRNRPAYGFEPGVGSSLLIVRD